MKGSGVHGWFRCRCKGNQGNLCVANMFVGCGEYWELESGVDSAADMTPALLKLFQKYSSLGQTPGLKALLDDQKTWITWCGMGNN